MMPRLAHAGSPRKDKMMLSTPTKPSAANDDTTLESDSPSKARKRLASAAAPDSRPAVAPRTTGNIATSIATNNNQIQPNQPNEIQEIVDQTTMSSEGHDQAVEPPSQGRQPEITPIADDNRPSSSMMRASSSHVADGDINDAETAASSAQDSLELPPAAHEEVTHDDIEAEQALRVLRAAEIISHPLTHITFTSSMGSTPPGSPAQVGVLSTPSIAHSDNIEEGEEDDV